MRKATQLRAVTGVTREAGSAQPHKGMSNAQPKQIWGDVSKAQYKHYHICKYFLSYISKESTKSVRCHNLHSYLWIWLQDAIITISFSIACIYILNWASGFLFICFWIHFDQKPAPGRLFQLWFKTYILFFVQTAWISSTEGKTQSKPNIISSL